MASRKIKNGYWAKRTNQIKAIGRMLESHGLLDPIDAGKELTLRMIESSDCTNIRRYAPTKYALLSIYFGNRLKPWMIRKHAARISWDKAAITECIDLVLKKTGVDIHQLTVREFERNGGHRLLYDFKHDFNKVKSIYLDEQLMPWEHRQVARGFWKQKANVRAAVMWLVQKKLRLKLNELTTELTTEDFVEHGLSALVMRYSVADLVMLTFPELKFKKSDFRQVTVKSVMGYAFENVAYRCLREGLKLRFKSQEAVRGCSHPVKCRIDVAALSLPGLIKRTDGVDIKLYTYTYFRSKTSRYLDHFPRLVLVYLDGAVPKKHDSKIQFLNIDTLIELVGDAGLKRELSEEVNLLRIGKFPKRLETYRQIAVGGYSQSKCRLFERGNCTQNKSTAEVGVVHSLGLCSKHWSQLRDGKIDETGKKQRHFVERVNLKSEQVEFLKANFRTMGNIELAGKIYGKANRAMGSRVNGVLRRLGLVRTQDEIARVRGQEIVYNSRTLKILRKYGGKKTLGEICVKLGIQNSQRNRSRIAEALVRYKIREKTRPYSKDELILELKKFARKLGRSPSPKDLDKARDVPGKGTYARIFGSWKNAKKVAGV